MVDQKQGVHASADISCRLLGRPSSDPTRSFNSETPRLRASLYEVKRADACCPRRCVVDCNARSSTVQDFHDDRL
jgi:hypothetical protein